MDGTHDVFHVSALRKYIFDPAHEIDFTPLELGKNLSYDERQVRILTHETKELRSWVIREGTVEKSQGARGDLGARGSDDGSYRFLFETFHEVWIFNFENETLYRGRGCSILLLYGRAGVLLFS